MALDNATRDECAAWLRFTLAPGIFGAAQRALLHAFGTPQQALGASVETLSRVVGGPIAESLARGPEPRELERAWRWLDDPGHHLVTVAEARYPAALREIADPPPVLYVIGRVDLLNAPGLAIVGSRNATTGGPQDAEAFARALSEAGLTIVSGLALGIDAAAHRGGLAGPGSSVAVLGTGANRVYPRANLALGAHLAREGALVSEFPLGMPPLAQNFPQRNRIISGLARGVLVVEAAPASGSLITAKEALDQNREVFAIPGSIHSPLSRGCHQLIRDGAKLVACAADVLEELHMDVDAPMSLPPRRASPEHRAFLDAMGFGPVTVDQIARVTGQGAAEVAARLCELEIAGAIGSAAGGRFQRLG